MLLGEHAMDLPSVFDWFAQDSIRAAAQTDEPRKREILLKLASRWAAAAQRCRDEQLKLRPGIAAVYLNIELMGGSLLKMKSPAQGRAKVCDECQW